MKMMMTYYITKYALTKGILKVEGYEVAHRVSKTMISHPDSRGEMPCYHKPFWHDTFEDAQIHADNLRDEAIKSLEKRLKRLRNLQFKEFSYEW